VLLRLLQLLLVLLRLVLRLVLLVLALLLRQLLVLRQLLLVLLRLVLLRLVLLRLVLLQLLQLLQSVPSRQRIIVHRQTISQHHRMAGVWGRRHRHQGTHLLVGSAPRCATVLHPAAFVRGLARLVAQEHLLHAHLRARARAENSRLFVLVEAVCDLLSATWPPSYQHHRGGARRATTPHACGHTPAAAEAVVAAAAADTDAVQRCWSRSSSSCGAGGRWTCRGSRCTTGPAFEGTSGRECVPAPGCATGPER
jgi:hypothetical protein